MPFANLAEAEANFYALADAAHIPRAYSEHWRDRTKAAYDPWGPDEWFKYVSAGEGAAAVNYCSTSWENDGRNHPAWIDVAGGVLQGHNPRDSHMPDNTRSAP